MSCYFERGKSDFPEFDRAYKTVLLPENPDRFDLIAAEANFNMYHHDLWRGTAERFARMVVEESIKCCGSQADKNNIRRHFGLNVTTDYHEYHGRELDAEINHHRANPK